MGEDEVGYSYGGDRVGLYAAHHQAQTDGAGEQNHRVDHDEGCPILNISTIIC